MPEQQKKQRNDKIEKDFYGGLHTNKSNFAGTTKGGWKVMTTTTKVSSSSNNNKKKKTKVVDNDDDGLKSSTVKKGKKAKKEDCSDNNNNNDNSTSRNSFPLTIRKQPSGESFWLQCQPTYRISTLQQKIHKMRGIPLCNIRLVLPSSLYNADVNNVDTDNDKEATAFQQRTLESLGINDNNNNKKLLELASISLFVRTPKGKKMFLKDVVDAECNVDEIERLVLEELIRRNNTEGVGNNKRKRIQLYYDHFPLQRGHPITKYKIKHKGVIELKFVEEKETLRPKKIRPPSSTVTTAPKNQNTIRKRIPKAAAKTAIIHPSKIEIKSEKKISSNVVPRKNKSVMKRKTMVAKAEDATMSATKSSHTNSTEAAATPKTIKPKMKIKKKSPSSFATDNKSSMVKKPKVVSQKDNNKYSSPTSVMDTIPCLMEDKTDVSTEDLYLINMEDDECGNDDHEAGGRDDDTDDCNNRIDDPRNKQRYASPKAPIEYELEMDGSSHLTTSNSTATTTIDDIKDILEERIGIKDGIFVLPMKKIGDDDDDYDNGNNSNGDGNELENNISTSNNTSERLEQEIDYVVATAAVVTTVAPIAKMEKKKKEKRQRNVAPPKSTITVNAPNGRIFTVVIDDDNDEGGSNTMRKKIAKEAGMLLRDLRLSRAIDNDHYHKEMNKDFVPSHGDVLNIMSPSITIKVPTTMKNAGDQEGGTFTLDVLPTDTAKNVREKIATKARIPIQELRLVKGSAKEELDESFMPSHGDELRIKPRRATIKTPLDGAVFLVDIDPDDTTKDIRRKVAEETGMSFEYIRLVIGDNKTAIEDISIPKHGEIYTVEGPSATFAAAVKLPNETNLDICAAVATPPTTTIADIRESIEERIAKTKSEEEGAFNAAKSIAETKKKVEGEAAVAAAKSITETKNKAEEEGTVTVAKDDTEAKSKAEGQDKKKEDEEAVALAKAKIEIETKKKMEEEAAFSKAKVAAKAKKVEEEEERMRMDAEAKEEAQEEEIMRIEVEAKKYTEEEKRIRMMEAEIIATERIEKDRQELERLELGRIEQERQQQENERLENERIKREQAELERIEKERLELERIGREQREGIELERRIELERQEKEGLELERIEKEKREQIEREDAEAATEKLKLNVENDEVGPVIITVNTPDETAFELEILLEDTAKEVWQNIATEVNIPIEDLRLSINGKEMDRSLIPSSGDILDVVIPKVTVAVDGEEVELEAFHDTVIGDIKGALQEETGIHHTNQILFLFENSQVLDDDMPIKNDVKLRLESFTISVLCWSGDLVELCGISSKTSVDEIKERLAQEKSVPKEKLTLSKGGSILAENQKVLSDYGVEHRDILMLANPDKTEVKNQPVSFFRRAKGYFSNPASRGHAEVEVKADEDTTEKVKGEEIENPEENHHQPSSPSASISSDRDSHEKYCIVTKEGCTVAADGGIESLPQSTSSTIPSSSNDYSEDDRDDDDDDNDNDDDNNNGNGNDNDDDDDDDDNSSSKCSSAGWSDDDDSDSDCYSDDEDEDEDGNNEVNTIIVITPDLTPITVTISLDTTTTRDVKTNISQIIDIPINALRLCKHDGSIPITDDFQLSPGDILTVQLPAIIVTLPDHSTLELSIYPNTTIDDVKDYLEEKTGTIKSNQLLYFMEDANKEHELDDTMHIETDCNIQMDIIINGFDCDDDVLVIEEEVVDPVVTVTLPHDDEILELETSPGTLIGDIKEILADETGISMSDQKLLSMVDYSGGKESNQYDDDMPVTKDMNLKLLDLSNSRVPTDDEDNAHMEDDSASIDDDSHSPTDTDANIGTASSDVDYEEEEEEEVNSDERIVLKNRALEALRRVTTATAKNERRRQQDKASDTTSTTAAATATTTTIEERNIDDLIAKIKERSEARKRAKRMTQ
jgi:hypothetical protein